MPIFAPVAVILSWFYIRIALPYIRASRDLRRLESISLSPAFAGFDELLNGLPHIRAFAVEERYQESFYNKVDKFQGFDHVYVGNENLKGLCGADWVLVAMFWVVEMEIRLYVCLSP